MEETERNMRRNPPKINETIRSKIERSRKRKTKTSGKSFNQASSPALEISEDLFHSSWIVPRTSVHPTIYSLLFHFYYRVRRMRVKEIRKPERRRG